MLPVESAFKIYVDLDGDPLDQGYIYFGQVNQNPITAPVTVYWDAAGTQPAAQPLRTLNGYIVRNGTPANVFYTGSYSQLVQDKRRRQVYYSRNSDDYSIATVVQNFIANLVASAGSSLIGFIQAGTGAIARTVQAELRDTVSVKQFGALGGGADDTAAIQKAVNYAILAGKKLRFPRDTYKLTGPVTARANGLVIDGEGSGIVLGNSTAGFLVAGSSNEISGLSFTQLVQTDTPLAITLFNDATTVLSIHNKVTECEFTSVYRGIKVMMNLNGAGQACYRQIITRCVLQNFYLQKTWVGSYGISFDGPNSGDAGGNDSKCIDCLVKGYEKNYLINNSASTQFANCTGDGAASNFSYEGGSSGLQIIGGYYEFNDAFIGVVGAQKYDAYILYPSYGNNTNAITGAGIQFISGGTYVSAGFFDISNGHFKTNGPTGVAEIFASNGLNIYSNNAKVLRLNLDNAGEWVLQNGGRFILNSPMWLVTNKVEGYTGGLTPLDLKAANLVTMTTVNTERLRVNNVGDILVPGAYASTTASAANMFVAVDGTFQRSTSSGKYKTDVETIYPDLADAIFAMRPVWYRSTCETDRKEWSWYGLIAEEVAAIEPRLVHWGYSRYLEVEVSPAVPAADAVFDEHGNEVSPAREAIPAQNRVVPDVESPLTPEGVQYDRITVLLIDVIQRQRQELAALSARVSALESQAGSAP